MTSTTHGKLEIVCFDCDSTLCRIEGIDVLAARNGCEAEVARLTEAAMSGAVPLGEVYAKRLALVAPDREALDWLGQLYVSEMLPDAGDTVEALRRLGKDVHVVSGGLLPAVRALGRALDLPEAHIHAVPIQFDVRGNYEGFDTGSPLARTDGKAVICRMLGEGRGGVAMVGDGVTDLEARAGGAMVVGFGGVAYRTALEEAADHYVAGPELAATLDVLLTAEERQALRAWSAA